MSALQRAVAGQVVTFTFVNATTGAALIGATGIQAWITNDGVQNGSEFGVTEIGNGQYKVTPTATECNSDTVAFYCTATNAVPVNLHCFTVPAGTVAEQVWSEAVPGAFGTGSAGAILGLINGAAISATFSGPVAAGGSVSVIRGDDYHLTDGRELEWTITDPIDLTGATVTIYSNQAGTLFTKALTVTTATGPTKIMYLNLTAAETTAMALGTHGFDLRATLASARVGTLLYSGKISVVARQA